MDIEGWDRRYAAESDVPGRCPTPLLAEIAFGLKPGRALDLACGTGRNALWLAQHGWQVMAVDGSANAIRQLHASAAAEGLHIESSIADLEDSAFTLPLAEFDLVTILFYLQRNLFQRAQASVKPGGTLITIAHTVETGEQPTPHRLEVGELQTYFDDWEILHYREGKPNDEEHRRAVAEIVARRPAAILDE